MKFKYEDLQPRVETLIDALENKGACASGLPYNAGVKELAQDYKNMLAQIRSNDITEIFLKLGLNTAKAFALCRSENNQYDRVRKIVEALDFYMMREYNKFNS